MPVKNSNLLQAKDNKTDEFYTRLSDIAKEVEFHKSEFFGKSVYCNCDDPVWSAFWEYFHVNFSDLGLRKLTATYYEKSSCVYVTEYDGGADGDISAGARRPLKSNGDFRSLECLALLDEADVVVTNPPFSLFKSYFASLVERNKAFLVIGNMNAVTYKDIFPFIKADKVWYGASIRGGGIMFRVPNDYSLNAAYCRTDKDGNRYIRVKGVRWFTNLDYPERHSELYLREAYDPSRYPAYDNYDAIEVGKTADIPADYFGVMGVPLSYYDRYDPDQFEIVGASEQCGRGASCGLWHKESGETHPMINGEKLYSRLFIRRRSLVC